jgi:hypothetical protein
LGERRAFAGGSTGQIVQVAIEAVDGAGRQEAGGASGRCCMSPSMGGAGSAGGKELAFACEVGDRKEDFHLVQVFWAFVRASQSSVART